MRGGKGAAAAIAPLADYVPVLAKGHEYKSHAGLVSHTTTHNRRDVRLGRHHRKRWTALDYVVLVYVIANTDGNTNLTLDS